MKDEFKGTKGEWKLNLPDGNVVYSSEGVKVATANFATSQQPIPTVMSAEESHANAKLIAAAPAMLAALIEISEGNGVFNRDRLIHASNTIDNMKELALEAIKKATS